MKKIINGKMYNTDTASCVATWNNGYGCTDFNYCEEELYRKKTGEFFLFGDGGARSKYAKHSGDSFSGGRDIVPLTEVEAKKWAETHCDADEYISIFGEVDE